MSREWRAQGDSAGFDELVVENRIHLECMDATRGSESWYLRLGSGDDAVTLWFSFYRHGRLVTLHGESAGGGFLIVDRRSAPAPRAALAQPEDVPAAEDSFDRLKRAFRPGLDRLSNPLDFIGPGRYEPPASPPAPAQPEDGGEGEAEKRETRLQALGFTGERPVGGCADVLGLAPTPAPVGGKAGG
jgi:hypothetical protein